MSETIPFSSGPATLRDLPADSSYLAVPSSSAGAHHFRSRIGDGRAGGYFPAPHRYQVFLSPGCPLSLRVAITLDLLGLREAVTVTLLGLPADTPCAHASLREAYEATWHRYDGPLTVPALRDRWSGRVVSNHTDDILRDLADHFTDKDDTSQPRLRPPALGDGMEALRELIDDDITQAAQRAGAAPATQRHGEPLETLLTALELLDCRLASSPYVLGGELTAADVDCWVALVCLDAVHRLHLDADTVRLISRYGHLWSYVRRLHGHPAFHRNLHPAHIARHHRYTCRGPESSGAEVTLPGVLATRPA